MKKILLLLLLATFSIQSQTLQNPTYGNVKLKNNTTDNSATKVNVQSTDGTINTISKSDLVNVVEVNDVPSLPLVGEVGKIYVVKNVNKIYRWNGTFYQELAGTDISGLQAQIDLKANDSDVVKLTGDQTISGQKSFSLTGKIDMQTNNVFPAISVTSLGSNGQSAATFINNSSSPYSTALILKTGSSGGVGNRALDVLNTSPIGTGIVSNASNGGVSISSQSGNGDSYISNITSGGTGRNYVGRNNGTETYSVDKIGNVIGNSYIKRSTPVNNILLAGGGDLAQNTAFNKNFGTTAGTVVEGGTLGSNAYNSTAYLPLTGGTLTGGLTIPYAIFDNGIRAYSIENNSTSVGMADLVAGAFRWRLNSSGVFNIANLSGTGTRPIGATSSGDLVPMGVGYKVYTALLSQSGTSAPVATVLENTLGGTVVWSREAAGFYNATLTGGFTLNKTTVLITQGTGQAIYSAYGDTSTNYVKLIGYSFAGIQLDNLLNKTTIEIRVYN